MTLGADPHRLEFGADADSAGVWVARVPLPGQCGVLLHRAAETQAPVPTVTFGADGIAITVVHEVACPCLPLVQPAAAVLAAWAAQPHLLTTAVCEVCRHLAPVLGRVPQLLNLAVVRMRRDPPVFGIESSSCTYPP